MIAPLPEPAVDRSARIPHVAALDGLRGVAVVGVLLFHADHLRGGFLGVDLFFTLSGFLITSLLVVEHQRTGRISLRGFWARRARRLLPAMLAVVAASTVVAGVILPEAEMARFGTQALATLAYVANWAEIAGARDYWALFDTPTPLEHVWSLAIEEQFYVVWPLLVLLAVRLLGRQVGIRALVAIGLAGSLLVAWLVADDAEGITRAYYGTDTRAASILVGAALATFTAGRSRRRSPAERTLGVAAVVALPLLVASWFVVDGSDLWLYRGGLLAHALLTAVVIAAVAGPAPAWCGSVLSWRPFVHVGVLSYGLYLWHWPVYVVLDQARTGLDGWTLTGVRLAVSFALATASFHLLEAPIRSQRWRFARPGLVTSGALGSTAALVLAVAWPLGAGSDPADDVAVMSNTPAAPGPDGGEALLVIGDASAASLGHDLVAAGREADIDVQVETRVGCTLLVAGGAVRSGDGTVRRDPPGCADWRAGWGDLVAEHEADAVLVMLAGDGAGERDLGDGRYRGPCDPTFGAHYDAQLRAAVGDLSAGGARVVVATTPPHATDRTHDDRIRCLNERIQAVSGEEGPEVLNLATWTCLDRTCTGGADPYRPDGERFAGAGAEVAARWIIDETARLTGLDGVPFVVVVGDSQAFRLVEHAPSFTELDLRVGSLATLGCGLSTQAVVMDGEEITQDECGATLDSLVEQLAALEADAVAVHAGAWEALDQVTPEGRVPFGDPRWEDRLRGNVAATLRRLAEGRELIAVTTPCYAPGPGHDAFGEDDLALRLAAYNEALVQETRLLGGSVVDLASHLCPAGEPRVEIGGVTVRPDGVHVERAGARVLWPWLAEQLREVAAPLG